MKHSFNRVSVVGLGYIGLPTAAVLAGRGLDVVGVDVNPQVIETLNRGEIHIAEPDLDIVVRAAVKEGKLKATLTPEPADVFFIAVPTPFKENHVPDMKYVHAASLAIAPVLKKGDLVVLESTSPVGSTEQMALWMAEARPDLTFPHQDVKESDVMVAHCPERVLPGHVLRELVENDRVIGGLTPRCSQRAKEAYQIFVQGECVITDARTAEMAKLTENAFRDVNIAFANELSLISEKLGINVWELISLSNRHPRVNILQPGPGVGGHCIAVDPWFIVDAAPEESRLIKTAREVNDGKPLYVLSQIEKAASNFASPTIALMGLAFKPDIDDLRESPAVQIAQMVVQKKYPRVLVAEPFIEDLPPVLSDCELVDTSEAIKQADIIVLLVHHKTFIETDRTLLKGKKIIDTRGIWQ